MEKISLTASPSIANELAPDPTIVRFLVTWIAPVESLMIEQEGESAKLIVSPELALFTVSRKDPAPELLQFVTVRVAAAAGVTATRLVVPAMRKKATTTARRMDATYRFSPSRRFISQLPPGI